MGISLLEQRRVEAEVLKQVFDCALADMGRDKALALVRKAVERSARKAGRAFADQEEDGPSLLHFATMLARIREKPGTHEQIDHTRVDEVSLTSNEFCFTVTRCGYYEMYSAMDMEDDLSQVLSCARDAAFAEGYSNHLILERGSTIAQGFDTCRFRYIWKD